MLQNAEHKQGELRGEIHQTFNIISAVKIFFTQISTHHKCVMIIHILI